MTSLGFDQFTRWTCPKCGKPGFDSWNKAMHDGIDHAGEYPNPAVLGDMCQACTSNAAVCYTLPDSPPTIIWVADDWSDEIEEMNRLEATPWAGKALEPSDKRDSDWSGGCVAAKGQIQ